MDRNTFLKLASAVGGGSLLQPWRQPASVAGGGESRSGVDVNQPGEDVNQLGEDVNQLGEGKVQPGSQSVSDSFPQPKGFNIPLIDLASETDRQVVVDREPGQYLGHPTTVLLEDQKTMLSVYPRGHGRGPIVLKRSTDGGLTWSDRLPVPENWATSQETPTIYRVVDPEGARRLILFSGLYPVRMAVSEDDGESWTPLEEVGDFVGIVAMSHLIRLRDGSDMTFFDDDGRFIKGPYAHWGDDGITGGGERGDFVVYKTRLTDGGLSWTDPVVVVTDPLAQLCEPGVIRSPDGKQIAMLLREHSRQHNSFVTFSDDEGTTWSQPAELPGALSGDRHQAVDGRDESLFIPL